MELQALLTALQAGGNAAMIALFFLMWRFDRRLIEIEAWMRFHERKQQQ